MYATTSPAGSRKQPLERPQTSEGGQDWDVHKLDRRGAKNLQTAREVGGGIVPLLKRLLQTLARKLPKAGRSGRNSERGNTRVFWQRDKGKLDEKK